MTYAEAFINGSPDAPRHGCGTSDPLLCGDPLLLCYAAWRTELAGDGLEEAAEKILRYPDSDAGPASGSFPSLSVGDVVSLRDAGGASASFCVGASGLRRLESGEWWATPAEHTRHREAVGEAPLVRIVVEGGHARVLSKPPGVAVEIADVDPDAEEPVLVKTSGPVGHE